jgi:hypothetical protein
LRVFRNSAIRSNWKETWQKGAKFNLEAAASVLATGGQRELRMKVVPSAGGNGWDIVQEDTAESVANRPMIAGRQFINEP